METQNNKMQNDVPTTEEQINWLPWIIGVLLLLASLWYFKGCRDKVNEMKAVEAEASAKATKDSIDRSGSRSEQAELQK